MSLIRLIPLNPGYNFLRYRKIAFMLSLIITMLSLLMLAGRGLNLGIDFAGGILLEFSSNRKVAIEEIRQVFTENGYSSPNIQEYYDDANNSELRKNFIVKLQAINNQDHSKEINNIRAFIGNFTPNFTQKFAKNSKDSENFKTSRVSISNYKTASDNEKDTILNQENATRISIDSAKDSSENAAAIRILKIDFVGPKVGMDFVKSSSKAVILALCVMMLYTLIRFNWQFSIGVLIALTHDVIATLGFFSITRYEFDLTSIAAILTIIGYSINDSIVIYDRIRENLRQKNPKKLVELINTSINDTFSRSIMTVATTLIVCLVLAIFGGEYLKSFSMATLFGIAFGTYSSIYISAPILSIFPHKYRIA